MKSKKIVINERYEIYPDGCVYDTTHAKDIPSYVFVVRDVLISNWSRVKDIQSVSI